jgi:hypothetical protein
MQGKHIELNAAIRQCDDKIHENPIPSLSLLGFRSFDIKKFHLEIECRMRRYVRWESARTICLARVHGKHLLHGRKDSIHNRVLRSELLSGP